MRKESGEKESSLFIVSGEIVCMVMKIKF